MPPTGFDPQGLAFHLRIVGILHLVASAAAVLAAIGFSVLLAVGGAPGRWLADQFPGPEGGFAVLFVLGALGYAALSGAAGVLVLRRRRVGRLPAAVTASLALLNFPIGTAFGLYSLLVTLHRHTDALWVDE